MRRYITIGAAIQDVNDFIKYETDTSTIYPWATPANKITKTQVRQIALKAIMNNGEDTELGSDAIYDACDEILGVTTVAVHGAARA